jgi:murein DD-endopeptidase MepM/ murein hydrolase activator NlpD
VKSYKWATGLFMLVAVPFLAAVPVAQATLRYDGPVLPPDGGVVPVRGPVDYGTQTNGFGAQRSGHVHNGQDMFAPTGTPLLAVRDAVVLESGSDGGRGNYLVLYSSAVRESYVYFHMLQPARVKPGQHVRAGKRVGALGCSGSCDGAHLHFEVHRGRNASGQGIDPRPLLRRWHHVAAR